MEGIRPGVAWTRRRVRFLLGPTRVEGEVVSENLATVRVKLLGGMIIRRHKVKHQVEAIQEGA